jgi:hypothetical protein
MKRLFFLLALAVVLLTGVIIASRATADDSKYHNSFIRIFPPHVAILTAELKMENGKFSLVGCANSKIYLQEHSKRGGILSTDLNLKDSVHIPLNIPDGFELVVDGPNYFLTNGYRAIIQRGKLQDCSVDQTFDQLPGYTAVQPLSKSSFVLRSIDPSKRKHELIKSNEPNSIKDILSTQVDGVFCTDGYFGYSKDHCLLVYTYRYRNQFLCLDTALNVRMIGKTIDTTTQAKISVAEVDGEIKLSKPPLVVNKGTCISGRYLFVNSNLMAKNEIRHQSNTTSVIDTYDILDGHYVASFYIDDLDESKMQSFSVNGHSLVAVFPEHIVVYNLAEKYLPI